MLMITVLEIQQGKEQIAGHGNIPADEQAGRPGPRAQALKNTVQHRGDQKTDKKIRMRLHPGFNMAKRCFYHSYSFDLAHDR